MLASNITHTEYLEKATSTLHMIQQQQQPLS